MGSIIVAALPLVLKIASWIIGRSQTRAEEQRQWIMITEKIAKNLSISVNLYRSDEVQKLDVNQQWDEKYGDAEIVARERQNPGMKFKRDENGNIVPDTKRTEA